MDNPTTPIAVVGPTASGKSALGVSLAHHLNGEVVNVDSMQLYKGMDIGTAKLTLEEREGIVHHLLDVWDISETASVARYQSQAIAVVEDIQRRGKTPILVGGSMLYVQSLVDDWQFPPTDPSVRAKWESKLNEVGVEALHALLAQKDPQAASIIELKDPRRTVRALEVIELTGKPFNASQPPKNAPPRWNTQIIGLGTNTEWLNPRIDLRTELMFEKGFVHEVENLVGKGLIADSTAGHAIGYAQVLQHFSGELSVDEMIEHTKIGTRRYVRRQRSWFKRDPRIHWIDASGDSFSMALSLLS